jgi:thiamine pyrophosphate-dependent acetolactate synthase large subunit-like protein
MLIVMHNNQSFYNSEEHGIELAKFRKRPVENAGIGTHVSEPLVDYAAVARGFGVHAEGPIEKPSDVRPAIERALKFVKEKNLPALVDVVSEPR